jgi:hypothetical protein
MIVQVRKSNTSEKMNVDVGYIENDDENYVLELTSLNGDLETGDIIELNGKLWLYKDSFNFTIITENDCIEFKKAA